MNPIYIYYLLLNYSHIYIILNIAKKFGTTIDVLKELNNLDNDSIYPNQQLIITKRVDRADANLI